MTKAEMIAMHQELVQLRFEREIVLGIFQDMGRLNNSTVSSWVRQNRNKMSTISSLNYFALLLSSLDNAICTVSDETALTTLYNIRSIFLGNSKIEGVVDPTCKRHYIDNIEHMLSLEKDDPWAGKRYGHAASAERSPIWTNDISLEDINKELLEIVGLIDRDYKKLIDLESSINADPKEDHEVLTILTLEETVKTILNSCRRLLYLKTRISNKAESLKAENETLQMREESV